MEDGYLQKLYKEETGEDAMSSIQCMTNCQFDDPVDVPFFNDEYVWWLESKIESKMKTRLTHETS